MSALEKTLLESVKRLTETQQLFLLNFITSLAPSPSNQGLLRFAGAFPTEDVTAMEIAITDCEKIDYDGW